MRTSLDTMRQASTGLKSVQRLTFKSGIYVPLVLMGWLSGHSAYAVECGTSVTANCSITISNTNNYSWTGGSITISPSTSMAESSTTDAVFLVPSGTVGTLTFGVGSSVMGANAFYGDVVKNAGGTITSLDNSGTLSLQYGTAVFYNTGGGTITSITNQGVGVIDGTGGAEAGVQNDSGSTVGTITNAGILRGSDAIENYGSITTIVNTSTGSIQPSTGDAYGNGVYNGGTITTITNFGTIVSGVNAFGINNGGTITTVNNAQGGGNASGALTYTGALPTNYNIILGSNATIYGKLAATSITGTTAFGVYSGSTVKSTQYAGVLAGVASTNLTGLLGSYNSTNLVGLTGTFGGQSWELEESAYQSGIWDLLFPNYVPTSSSAGPVTSAVIAQGNAPGVGAARVIDGSPNLSSLFAGLSSDQAISNAVTQTLPVFMGASARASAAALSAVNRIIEARIESNSGLSSGAEFIGNRFLWLKPLGSWAAQSDHDDVSGYKARVGGLVFGSDATISNSSRVGLSFAYAQANINGNGSSNHSQDSKIYALTGYGSWVLPGSGAELSYQLSFGQNHNDSSRQIAFTNSTASASYNSSTAHVGLGLGQSFSITAQDSITPAVHLDYTHIHDHGYTEAGAGDLDLSVDSLNTEEAIVSFDGKLTHALSEHMSIAALLGVGYDFDAKAPIVGSTFAGAPGVAFTTTGAAPGHFLVRGGLGLSSNTGGALTLSARYDIEHREGFNNQVVSVKARWAF